MINDQFFNTDILLENEKVLISPLLPEHFMALLPVAMEKSLWQFTTAKINTEADFKHYFDTALAEREQKKSYPFAIFDKEKGEFAGSTRYGNIDFQNLKTEIGWTWIKTSMHGTGFNKQCKFLLLQYAFETLLLNRVELKTNVLNERS